MELADFLIIGSFLYILIGLILFIGQEKWVRENDKDFFEEINDLDWLKYFVVSVLIWLPCLIIFWGSDKHNKEE